MLDSRQSIERAFLSCAFRLAMIFVLGASEETYEHTDMALSR